MWQSAVTTRRAEVLMQFVFLLQPAVVDELTRKRESSLRQHSFFQLRVHLRRGVDLVARDKGGESKLLDYSLHSLWSHLVNWLHLFPHVESHLNNENYNVFRATTVLSTLHPHGDSVLEQ
jgi:hypothetical protein